MSSDSLGFLYRKVPISPTHMSIWLGIPEFEIEMMVLLKTNHTITNEDVLESMERICDFYESEKKQKKDLPPYVMLSGMRRSRNQLRRALGRDTIQN